VESFVFVAVLFAAAGHAGWNALIKVGLDPLSTSAGGPQRRLARRRPQREISHARQLLQPIAGGTDLLEAGQIS
jgi:hypothetical protein